MAGGDPVDMENTGREETSGRWKFWIDRGGTFTDIVAERPGGELVTHKLLSENPQRYEDAAIQGIRNCLGLADGESLPREAIHSVKMGSTVATNALLERQGEPTALVITAGFADILRIGHQNRPDIFALDIQLPEMLYDTVLEVEERVRADGEVLVALNQPACRAQLAAIFAGGIRSLAIVCLHGYRYPGHEQAIKAIAEDIGFRQISVSSETNPLMKVVSRGDTTVCDAYLSPVIYRYVNRLSSQLGDTPLMFMQSNGGLADARVFHGRNAVLSGPAGGIVGMVKAAAVAGFDKIIGFDMGGTSTDVSHYQGEFERVYETEVAGVRLRAPMMHINTVAAGGGSILGYDGARFRVGPQSAGADPGPACYGKGGPLAVTDCNVMLGRVQADYFPRLFGASGKEKLSRQASVEKFSDIAKQARLSPEEVAEGFLHIAVENMANAIKKISVQRGYDVSGYTLCSFGGAGGQHACRVADALDMAKVFVHPFAGVLSAYGIGAADIRMVKESSIELTLEDENMPRLEATAEMLNRAAKKSLLEQGLAASRLSFSTMVRLRYQGTDTSISVAKAGGVAMGEQFNGEHLRQFGFEMPDRRLVIESIAVEGVGRVAEVSERQIPGGEREGELAPEARVELYTGGAYRAAPIFRREKLLPGDIIDGPAIISEQTGTTVVEIGWRAEVNEFNHLILSRRAKKVRSSALGTKVDPVKLEVFNNLFRSIAEQMGITLAKTAHSVNIKERLDFSCAIFDEGGNLVSNAPHIPVHLGSMGDSVREVIKRRRRAMREGDSYVLNDPYNGGTHLPDITVVTPVFEEGNSSTILFFVASRGHHADIGGITPGSMPADSRTIDDEGVIIDNILAVRNGLFQEQEMRDILGSGKNPARNIEQNLADLRAQVAANSMGIVELKKVISAYGQEGVLAYMGHVQDNAEESVRRAIARLKDGSFRNVMDDGSVITVSISIDRAAREARIDFTGTSPQRGDNFNAPSSVAQAAVIYVFRTLVNDDIPLNEGCLTPIELIVPEGCFLNPRHPAAVAAGNVETSQAIVDTLFGALGTMAASQGTMNNFTFGDEEHQYYETICGGAGAGDGFDGTDAVHTHMTNSRLTDPEVIEWRFPVMVDSFAIRAASGGSGRHRGGDGVVRKIRFLKPMTASILSGHRKYPPYGMHGGGAGAVGRNYVRKASGEVNELGGTDTAEMKAGDVFVIETPGGGGYGE